MLKLCLLLSFVAISRGDVRAGSHPKHEYKVRNYKGSVKFVSQEIKYMEPSTFGYRGLEKQKQNNYDQFLRSNIDNEQDNRNFQNEDGEDHLPFRTMAAEAVVEYTVPNNPNNNISLVETIEVGKPYLIPMRWNNPHSSELEVNVWILNCGDQPCDQPIVVPIRKPACGAEGYQDVVVDYTVPTDFLQLGSRIPKFTGCNKAGDCAVQVYMHSVESRTYAFSFPVIVPGHDTSKVTSIPKINPQAVDPWLDLSQLRDLCLYSSSPAVNILTSVPRYARLVSDVYNHAYQDSDYSPYAGQQHERISKNLQAAAILKAITGNRGELGKSILTNEQKNNRNKLSALASRTYKAYEKEANKIIRSIEKEEAAKNTGNLIGTFPNGTRKQDLNTCFRCAVVGATSSRRLQTNTYIPSFKVPQEYYQRVEEGLDEKYKGLLNSNRNIQIYVAAVMDLKEAFENAAQYGIIYQPSKEKTTLTTMADETNFKKRRADGSTDQGQYAAKTAKRLHIESVGCQVACLECPAGTATLNNPLYKDDDHTGTCINYCAVVDGSGQCDTEVSALGTDCSACASLFSNGEVKFDVGPNAADFKDMIGELPDTGGHEVPDMPACENSGTSGAGVGEVFEQVGSGFCRGDSVDDNNPDWFRKTDYIGEALCKAECLKDPDCRAVELSGDKCEFWNRWPNTVAANIDAVCWRRGQACDTRVIEGFIGDLVDPCEGNDECKVNAAASVRINPDNVGQDPPDNVVYLADQFAPKSSTESSAVRTSAIVSLMLGCGAVLQL